MGAEVSSLNSLDNIRDSIMSISPKASAMFQKVISTMDPLKVRQHHSSAGRLRRAFSADSTDDPWGWFEDFDPSTTGNNLRADAEFAEQPLQRALSLPPPASAPPMYVLESTLATQQLWYSTAGQRPKQPQHEREYFESVWQRNFENSKVQYNEEALITDAVVNKPRDEIPAKEFEGEILFRGKGPFSNSVSKTFLEHDVAAMTLQLPRFRIVRTKDGEVHAEFLVVITFGSHSTVTFGVWRRHSDFQKLSIKVQSANLRSGRSNSFKNAMLSWQCLLHRKRWFRCLDKDYLSLKCFLLERFMHDLLFESPSPTMISDFLGLE